MKPLEVMQEAKTFAVAGVTQDTTKYGYKIYKKLKEKGYTVYGLNPQYDELEGDRLYKGLEELPTKPDVVVFVVNPKIGMSYVEACHHIGVQTIWLQPGTTSEELIAQAKGYGIEVIEACVLVVAQYLA